MVFKINQRVNAPLPPGFEWCLGLIRKLDLSFSNLVGSMSWPSLNSATLTHIVLRGNRLQISVPDLPKTIKEIDLSGNDIMGEIPDTWSSLQSLSRIDLSNCGLAGKYPLHLPASARTIKLASNLCLEPYQRNGTSMGH